MTRRRFVQREDGELVELKDGEEPTPRMASAQGVLWNDRAYQDAGDPRFASRTQHREFMKAHGLTTTDDFKSTWQKSEQQRVERRQARDVGARRADVEQAIRKTIAGYKPRLRRD